MMSGLLPKPKNWRHFQIKSTIEVLHQDSMMVFPVISMLLILLASPLWAVCTSIYAFGFQPDQLGSFAFFDITSLPSQMSSAIAS